MLARENRISKAADFRAVLRRGRRVSSSSVVVYVVDHHSTSPARFGFIVSKAVGNAVARNVTRRRMRAASRDLLPSLRGGKDVVVRALPGSHEVGWATLQAEMAESISRGVTKR